MRRRTLLRVPFALAGVAALRPRNVLAASPAPSVVAKRHVAVKLNRAIPLHPRLQYGAVAEPNKRVHVLVQRHEGYSSRDIAAYVGEAVHKEFSVVSAYGMVVAQRDLPKLAAHPGVRYISPDTRAHLLGHDDLATNLKTRYPIETGASAVWQGMGKISDDTGAGVTVAMMDTGFANHPDLKGMDRVNPSGGSTDDGHGHGTHNAGIIAGQNAKTGYIGVAPDAKLIGVRIADDNGAVTDSALLAGLEWVYNNHDAKKIRAVNLSLSVGTAESYHTSPMAAAVERLWNAGVTVVAAAGNLGSAANATWFAPGNDPYVITVGALDDNQTLLPGDDVLAPFSSFGPTQDGFAKPDILAPGRKIVSTLASPTCFLARTYANRITDTNYIRLSGTSAAAPMVTGVIALLLSRYPNLTPNQIKAILTRSAKHLGGVSGSANAIDTLAALALAAAGNYGSANAGLVPSVGLGSLTSGSGNESAWDESAWDSAYWDESAWDESAWDESAWDESAWDESAWD